MEISRHGRLGGWRGNGEGDGEENVGTVRTGCGGGSAAVGGWKRDWAVSVRYFRSTLRGDGGGSCVRMGDGCVRPCTWLTGRGWRKTGFTGGAALRELEGGGVIGVENGNVRVKRIERSDKKSIAGRRRREMEKK